MTDLCRLCTTNKISGPDLATRICTECRTNLGMQIEMPPPRRPALPCPRCRMTRFVRVLQREYVVLDSTTFGFLKDHGNRSAFVPVAATHEPKVVKKPPLGAIPDGHRTHGPDLSRPRGLIARYICCGCGFVELFCEDPESIPIGPEYLSDIVDYGPEAGYR